jgi:dCMP deaminase
LFKENNICGSFSKCPRKMLGAKSGERLDLCIAIHAEEDVILNCFESNRNPKGCKMYLTCGIPCMECLKKIIKVGISEVVVTSLDYYDNQSKYLIENSNFKIRLYDFMEKPSA